MVELVYLWVEDYKNIHGQGFNFSPRFECDFKAEYDVNGKLKDNCELVICDKAKNECKDNDYIENFFGDNINVTAIVGKNGSGKSSIFESMIQFNSSDKKKIHIFAIDGKLIVRHNFYDKLVTTDININSKIKISDLKNKKRINDSIKKILLLTNSTSETEGNNSNYSQVVHNNYNYNVQSFIDLLNNDKIKIPFYVPEYLHISSLTNDTPIRIQNTIEHYAKNHNIKSKLVSSNLFFEDNKEYRYSYLEFHLITAYLESNETNLSDTYYSLLLDIEDKQVKCLQDVISLLYKNIINSSTKQLIQTIVQQIKDYFIVDENLMFLKIKLKDIPRDFISNYKSITTIDKRIAKQPFNIFLFSLSKPLSTGEYQFLSIFALINKYIKDINIILIDEYDMSLHPLWQKEFMNYISKFFNDNFSNQKIHLVLTSHSPFLLSDIPKQNIIFLDTYEDGKCKVLKHEEVLEKKQTFGANIHTLLSDSFFMEDGLMGEFAKGKINEIIEFHKEVEEENKKEKSNFDSLKTRYEPDKVRFWQTQSIIGEDYLRQVIKNHLIDIENILLGYDEAKQEEIKRLRDEANRLENM